MPYSVVTAQQGRSTEMVKFEQESYVFLFLGLSNNAELYTCVRGGPALSSFSLAYYTQRMLGEGQGDQEPMYAYLKCHL